MTERSFRFRCPHCDAGIPRSVWLGRNCAHVCGECGTLLQVPSLWNCLCWMALLAVFVAGSLFMGARGTGVAVMAVATGIFWWVTGMFDMLEGHMLPPWVRALKYGRYFCQKCGYDLKAQEVKRCPECGKRFRRMIGSERGMPMDRWRGKARSGEKSE